MEEDISVFKAESKKSEKKYQTRLIMPYLQSRHRQES